MPRQELESNFISCCAINAAWLLAAAETCSLIGRVPSQQIEGCLNSRSLDCFLVEIQFS
jgi:hypothetical protein